MPADLIHLEEFVESIPRSPLAPWSSSAPWELTSRSESIVRSLLDGLSAADFLIANEVAIHRSTVVEAGAVLKGPLIVEANGFIAAGAYLRGGNWVAERCTFGPGSELKSSFVFAGTKLAHFNFVGDSILGVEVNLEAGSVVCNYRNERQDKEIIVRVGAQLQRTGHTKFGAVLGDYSRLGANAVVAPGGLLLPGSVLARATLRDDEACNRASAQIKPS
jgi:bifunctional N-acetylglucosamine-1-phosphate-uridyltransferase/glucosamine-1-phosphate-acetyltransferase GlmU-like protein